MGFCIRIVKKIQVDASTCTMPGIGLAELSLLLPLMFIINYVLLFFVGKNTIAKLLLSQNNHLFSLDNYVIYIFVLTMQKVTFLLNRPACSFLDLISFNVSLRRISITDNFRNIALCKLVQTCHQMW